MKTVSKLSKDSLILDVRSPAEFESEHIKNSINIPVDQIMLAKDKISQSKKNVVFVCRSGARSEMACKKLPELNGAILKGGLLEYKESTIKGTPRWDIERQIRLIVGLATLFGSTLGLLVNPWFFTIPIFFGAGLTFASITNTCAMGMMLSKLPYNKKGFSLEKELSKIK